MSLTVAVTGATGHVGENLIPRLLGAGHRVRALVYDNNHVLDGMDVERVPGDVLDDGSVARLVDGADKVVHMAAMISLESRRDDAAWRVNVEGTRNVVNACRAANVSRMIHFSSIHALSPFPLDQPVTELNALCGTDGFPYDASKAAGDRVVLNAVEQGLDAVIISPTAVIGPGDQVGSRMGRLISQIAQDGPAWTSAGGFNWVDVRDICVGVLSALEKGRRGERYLLAGEHASLKELHHRINAIVGRESQVYAVPKTILLASVPLTAPFRSRSAALSSLTRAAVTALERHQIVDDAKARGELGHAPRPLDETLRDTVAWWHEFEKEGARAEATL